MLNTLKISLFISLFSFYLSNNGAYSKEVEEISKAEMLIAQFSPVTIASGVFVQRKYFKVLKYPITSQGELYVEKGLGLLWQTNQPVFSKMLLKNDGLFTDDGIQPVTEIKGAVKIASIMMKTMTGDINGLKQDFFIALTADVNCVDLKPKAKQLAQVVRSIMICQKDVDDLQKQLVNSTEISGLKNLTTYTRIVLFEQAGNRTEIDLQLLPITILPEAIRAQIQ